MSKTYDRVLGRICVQVFFYLIIDRETLNIPEQLLEQAIHAGCHKRTEIEAGHEKAVIVSAVITPFGSIGGSLRKIGATDQGAFVRYQLFAPVSIKGFQRFYPSDASVAHTPWTRQELYHTSQLL